MAKVLISFLGTGASVGEENGIVKKYSLAKYRFGGGKEYETSFIAEALKKHYQIERMILIGTPKSMWEEAYHAFADKPDPDIYCKIGEYCRKADHTTSVENRDFPHKSELDNALGGKVVLVHYGLGEEEIDYNSKLVLSNIEAELNEGDDLYVDVTHSFRSLPLILMNSLIFLSNVSKKHISIKAVSYGMLEASKELGYAPVVDLLPILRLNDWISGAAEFLGSGNSYKIADLIEKDSNATEADKYAAASLRELSDTLNLNYTSKMKKIVEDVRRIKKALFEIVIDKYL